MKGTSPRESSVVKKTKATSEAAALAQDAVYKKAFMNILTSEKKFLGMSLTIQEVLFEGEGRPSRKATVTVTPPN